MPQVGAVILHVNEEAPPALLTGRRTCASLMRTAFPLIITRDQADSGVDVITEVLRRYQW
jgi:4-aminobutyrate aminotransferase-like enzyme